MQFTIQNSDFPQVFDEISCIPKFDIEYLNDTYEIQRHYYEKPVIATNRPKIIKIYDARIYVPNTVTYVEFEYTQFFFFFLIIELYGTFSPAILRHPLIICFDHISSESGSFLEIIVPIYRCIGALDERNAVYSEEKKKQNIKLDDSALWK